MKKILLTFLIISFILKISSHSKEEWKSRTIYQILTDRFSNEKDSPNYCSDLKKYCGGTYKGIIKHLSYIEGMGFDAIWISPIVENYENSYHGYHLTNLYKLNPKFGSESDLKKLISECHKRNIWVMVDVVANHVAPIGTDYSKITPFNKAEHYHDICHITDWNNQWMVENCRLSDLPDLKQENDFVANELIKWINNIVREYKFDGIRIDTVPEVPKWFWEKFAKSAGVFQLGEVFNGNPDYVSSYQKVLDSVFNYPLYYTIKDSFCGNMRNLEGYYLHTRNKFKDPLALGIFVENHDNPRFLNKCRDWKKFKNAIIFSLFYEGIPVVYYGGEQFFSGGDDPLNREILWGKFNTNSEMYIAIREAIRVRKNKKIYNKKFVQRFADNSFYAFTRGDVLICVTRGESCNRKITYHEFKEGTKLCNIFNKNDCVKVISGTIDINMEKDPKVYVQK